MTGPHRVFVTPGPLTGNPRQWITSQPAGWDRRWLTARAAAAAGGPQARIAWFGDSLSVGEAAQSGAWTHGYVGLLRALLQSRYGDGGSGFIGPSHRNTGGSVFVTETGAWTNVDNEGGANGFCVRPTVSGNGATMTFPVRGTTIDIYTRADPSFGQVQRSIDGGANVAIPLNLTAQNVTTTITGLAPGDHTVRITANSGTSRLVGVRGRYPSGVLLDNFAHSGRRLDGLDNPSGISGNLIADHEVIRDSLEAAGDVDLVVIAAGVADALNATSHASLATIQPALDKAYSRIVTAGADDSDPPSVAIVISHSGLADTVPGFGLLTYEYAAVVGLLYEFARSVGAAVIDIWAMGRRSFTYFDSFGYFDASDVHLTDAGHAAVANVAMDLLA